MNPGNVTSDFCTLFDSAYLLKGLALHESLRAHAPGSRLWILCMDDAAYEVLSQVRLAEVELIALSDFEDDALKTVKGDRTRGEYCWTCTPGLPLYVLERDPSIEVITYVDADVYFFDDPAPIFDEFGDASIGLTEHRFASYSDSSAADRGIFNVECMLFRNDASGREALRWWRERCLEWCYNRVEEGRFADQKYLDDWPTRFTGVKVLREGWAGLAPWSAAGRPITPAADGLTVAGDPLVFYHFHQFDLVDGGRRYRSHAGTFGLTLAQVRTVYPPYLAALQRSLSRVRVIDPNWTHGIASRTIRERLDDAADWLKTLLRPLKPIR